MCFFKRAAKPTNEINETNESQNPWAGLASYEDPLTAKHKLKFCGREDETYDFAKLVMSNVFVTLYGKSGIGKTSLLNAGVFPEIREQGFTPISIRLGIRDEKDTKSYQSVIIEAIERNIPNYETINVIPEQTDAQKLDFLWNYFARHRFYTASGEPTSPVIVLDQFEELFRSNRDEVNALLKQLDYLNDKDNSLDIDEADGKPYRYETNFRFVISIREDDLYRLEDSIDNCYLPALKRCRYRLRSLSDEGAKDVIVTPGKGLFATAEKDNIVAKIMEIARNEEDGSINTNILSLVCNRIYVDSRKNGSLTIGLWVVENFVKGNPFERFYNEATRKLSNKEKSYIEDSLVDSTGRRNSVSESDFLLNVPNGEMLLHGDNRILQRTSASSDSKHFRVELIHDSFCPPLMGLKEQREKKRKAKIFAGLVTILLICIGIIVLIFSQRDTILERENTISQREKELEAKNAELEKKNAEIEKERDAAFLANSEKDDALSDLEDANARIFDENQRTLYAQSRLLANNAIKMVQDGDGFTASKLALELFSGKYPYTIEAEKALRDAYSAKVFSLKGHIMDVVRSVAYSPDGKYLVSGNWYNTIKLWDVSTGECIKTFEGHTEDVSSVAFSPDGNYIASGSWDKTIKLWNVATGECIKTFEGHAGSVYSVAFSPDGKYIASGSSDNTLKLWNVKTGECVRTFDEHTSWVQSVAFSPDGKYIASSSNDETIKLWNVTTGECIKTFEGHTYSVNSVAFSPDGKYIASGSWDKTIKLWNIATGECEKTFEGHIEWVNSVAFSPDGKYIVSYSNGCELKIWDIATGECIDSYISKGGRTVAFSPDGKQIAFDDGINNPIAIRELSTVEKLVINNEKYSTPMPIVSYCPNGKYIASGSWNDTIPLWNVATGKCVKTFEGHTSSVCSVAFSIDGRYMASGSSDNTIKLWNVETGECIKTFDGHKELVSSVTFSPNGKNIASGSYDNTVKLWNLATGECIKTFDVNSKLVESIVFSPDGQTIVSGSSSGTIKLWNVSTAECIKTFDWCRSSVVSVVFSPNGKYVASDGNDGKLKLWDVKTGECIKTFGGHQSFIQSVDFSSNGKYIVSGSWDATVKIWDVFSGECIKTFDGHNQPVTCVAFSPDGQTVASASRDKTIRLWEFPSVETILQRMRERYKGCELSKEERIQLGLE
ncbi:MAG: hypothetical protein ACI31F_03990 [Muribaculaceae bacterium]